MYLEILNYRFAKSQRIKIQDFLFSSLFRKVQVGENMQVVLFTKLAKWPPRCVGNIF